MLIFGLDGLDKHIILKLVIKIIPKISWNKWANEIKISMLFLNVDGQHLLVALQDTNLLELFTIDQKTGKITKVQQIKSNNSPTIVAFFS